MRHLTLNFYHKNNTVPQHLLHPPYLITHIPLLQRLFLKSPNAFTHRYQRFRPPTVAILLIRPNFSNFQPKRPMIYQVLVQHLCRRQLRIHHMPSYNQFKVPGQHHFSLNKQHHRQAMISFLPIPVYVMLQLVKSPNITPSCRRLVTRHNNNFHLFSSFEKFIVC